ncbi:MAG: ribonuclease J [Defluviitaleaceae bacterium]|nr:ribonuclease J [Defluviitaleaceae bacterium]
MASKSVSKLKLRAFALGGIHEIGKNLYVLEFGEDIIVVDCGVAFPEDDQLGIDLVIPDFSYLVKNRDRVKGVILTHGHEDHIGAVPYFMRELNVPLYGTTLTLGLSELKLKEHGLLNTVKRHCIQPGQSFKLGKHFEIEFISVTHSIAGAVALAIKTPAGVIVHTGDFKIDHTPIQGEKMDLQRFAELGKAGVLLFMCDSTNVELKGYTISERQVAESFENIFNKTQNNRIIVATFSSNIPRIQQIVNTAKRHGRRVAFVGRSMLNVVKVASELGYLNIPDKVLINIGDIKNYVDGQLVTITTGSQGEAMSALTRMSTNDHKQVEIKHGDRVIISASSIPGNEKSITRLINDLFKKGADVIYESLAEIHVSGHAKQEEIKLMHALLAPKYFMPIHGEYKHLKHHCELAAGMGMPRENVFLTNLGEVLEIGNEGAKINGTVTNGQVFVDGLGIGDVGNIVIRDRKILSEDGIIIVALSVEVETGQIISGPDIISRGFVYVRESDSLMEEMRAAARKALEKCERRNIVEYSYIKTEIRDAVKDFVWQKTKRNPMILPVIMEV